MKAPEEIIDDLIHDWNAGHGRGVPLHEYLGMDHAEYARFVEDGTVPPFYAPPDHGDEPLLPDPNEGMDTMSAGVYLLFALAFLLGMAWLAIHLGGPTP